jgi:hypothetical protein
LKRPDGSIEIPKYHSQALVDGISKTQTCIIESVVDDPTWINFTANHGDYKTKFSLNFISGLEITYLSEVSGLITITETCEKCQPERIQGNIIDYGFYEYDTKNEQHDSFKEIKQEGEDYKIVYEKQVEAKEVLFIDPTFSSNNPDFDSYLQDDTDCTNVTANGNGQTTLQVGVRSTQNDCWVAYIQWDTTTIPDTAIITDTVFKFDIASTSGTPENCDYMPMAFKPTTRTDNQILADIKDGTEYVNNNADCKSVGDNHSLDLGASADSDLQGLLASNWFAIGIKPNDLTGSGVSDFVSFVSEEGTGTPDPTLEVTYETQLATTTNLLLNVYNVGDTVKINGTIQLTDAWPLPINLDSIVLLRNGTILNTNSTNSTFSAVGQQISYGPLWDRMITDDVYNYTIFITIDNATAQVTNSTSNLLAREYDPIYSSAVDNPDIQGSVNHTISRFDDNDGIHMKVNRIGGTLSDSWDIECIMQTNTQAASTRNQSQSWSGTWVNLTDTGYFNQTWTGYSNTHGYVTCFNDDVLFTDVSYTNSSLALFGIGAFDSTWGSMLGVPVAVFGIVMIAGQANKRDAPTWIVVLLALAGIMATLGFFAIEPIVWGLALLSGMLGLFVNQKVF